jgi:RNA polymerase sigma factor (sigma-70 family)
MQDVEQRGLDAEASTVLVEQARTSRAAFAQLYRIYVDRVFRFCLAHTATAELAEDLTEDTFTKALDALTRPLGRAGRYEARGIPFSSWLLRIAGNTVRDCWRAGKRQPCSLDAPLGGEESDDPLRDRLVDPGNVDPAALIDQWECAARLRACLALLPHTYRHLLQLRYWDEYRWEAIAARMGRSSAAVHKLHARALRMLSVLTQPEEQLRAQLSMLPEEQQQVMGFWYLQRLDVATMARLMGRSAGSIEWLLARALKTLGEARPADWGSALPSGGDRVTRTRRLRSAE